MAEKVAKQSRLLKHLVQRGMLAEDGLLAILERQQEVGGHLLDILLDIEALSENELARALATYYRLPQVNLTRIRVTKRALRLAAGDFCEKYQVLPFSTDAKKGELQVAVSDPMDTAAVDTLGIRHDLKVRIYVAPRAQLKKAIDFYYFSGVMEGRGKGADESSEQQDPLTESRPLDATPPPPKAAPPARELTGARRAAFPPADSDLPFMESDTEDSSALRNQVPGTEDLGSVPLRRGRGDAPSSSRNRQRSAGVLRKPGSRQAVLSSSTSLGALNPFLEKTQSAANRDIDNRIADLEAEIERLDQALRYEMTVSQALAEVLVENGLISSEQLKSRLRRG